MDYNDLIEEIHHLEIMLAEARAEVRTLRVAVDDLEGELHRLERYGE